jgi:hypothetical protein
MKRTVFTAGACFLLFLLATLASPGIQIEKSVVAKWTPPHISSVSQEFYPMAINLILNGTRFPPKIGSGNIRRNIRLASVGGVGDAKGIAFYAGETGNWTQTRIDDLLGFSVQAGRKYRIGLVEFEAPGPNIKKLISNEVEFLLLMNLQTVTPEPVPYGTTEVEVATANELGPQGGKIVKLGNQQAQVTHWSGPALPGGNFKFRIPQGLAVPGIYDLYVEEKGIPVSKKIPIRLLGAKIK